MTTSKRIPRQKPPYSIDIGDRLFMDNPPKLGKNEVFRKMYATTKPYLVGNVWKVMTQDENDSSFTLETPLDGFHVVGSNKDSAPSLKPEKPTLVEGDLVQLRYCPNYASIETHRARLAADPYYAFGEWYAPIKVYGCIGSDSAIYKCKDMAFIKHKVVMPIKLTKVQELTNKVRSKMSNISKPAMITGVIVAFIAVIGLWGVANYNSLVGAKNAVENSKSKIDTELTRRYDLVDNIVQSVQGSQAQESEVFGKIAEARKIGSSSADITSDQSQKANSTIDTQIALLPRLQEQYPELKSNEQVTRLITELEGTNNSIRDTRNVYNDTVTNYNNNITSFPKNIFARIFGFEKAKLFEATVQEKANPKVELNREKN